jgi:hypothetical protein
VIDNVSNDFHSDDRCPMCEWSFISHCTSMPFVCSNHLRRAIAFKRRTSKQRTTVTCGGFSEAI